MLRWVLQSLEQLAGCVSLAQEERALSSAWHKVICKQSTNPFIAA